MEHVDLYVEKDNQGVSGEPKPCATNRLLLQHVLTALLIGYLVNFERSVSVFGQQS